MTIQSACPDQPTLQRLQQGRLSTRYTATWVKRDD
jgi:hypothetical protein